MTRILLPEANLEQVAREIGEFTVRTITDVGASGAVVGLSGGVDSTVAAALAKKAFDEYNAGGGETLELTGYILPSAVNDKKDSQDGQKVAEQLGIRYKTLNIQPLVEAHRHTNPEAFENNYDKGNMISRIRSNVLNTKAATERKIVLGTGNKDEDFGIGYYTLFGDGAVHISPIGNLSKRLVVGMAHYLGFPDIASRTPAAGLEPGQTDFKDLGYSYDVVELVTEGISQGFGLEELVRHDQVTQMVGTELPRSKHGSVQEVVEDIWYRHHNIALKKMQIIHPPAAPVTLDYKPVERIELEVEI